MYVMKEKSKALVIVAVLLNVPACSYVKTLFPDKEKDYQFTSEIPPLVMPADLGGDSIVKPPSVAPVAAAPAVAEPAVAAPAVAEPAAETVPTVERKLIRVELVDADHGAKRLHIGAPSTTAWRMVGKALSRKFIEVTNRSQEEELYHVQYDPNKQKAEETSVFDDVRFFFNGFMDTEQEYIIKMVKNNQQTDVIIMNKDEKPVTDSGGLSLLTQLHDAIKADLAK